MANEINDYLLRESNRIGTNIVQKMMKQMTPWISLYKQEAWKEQISSTQQTFQWDRAQLVADAEVAWDDVGINAGDADGGSCIPPADEVMFTQTNRSYNLQQKAIWGPRICVNDLRDTFVREKQMGASVKALADQARKVWINRKRDEYTRISDNLVVCDSAFTLDGGDYNKSIFPAYSGTDGSILTNGFTDYCYEYLNHHGGQEGALGMSDGRPVYGLVISPRTSRRLIHTDADIREDFRFSSQNEKLLGPMGVKYSYNGFSHLIDEMVNRWNFYYTAASGADGTGTIKVSGTTLTTYAADGTTATAISGVTVGSTFHAVAGATWTAASGSQLQYKVTAVLSSTTFTVTNESGGAPTAKGTAGTFGLWKFVPQFVKSGGKVIPNSGWLDAAWEDSYIFHQNVCTSLVPAPITSVGQASFDAVNYGGEYSFKNYADAVTNPDSNIGRFRGVLMNGTRPDEIEFGIVIRHRACSSATTDIVDCTDLAG